MAVTSDITPALQKKLKNHTFTKRLETATKNWSVCKIKFKLKAFCLNVFLYKLEEP